MATEISLNCLVLGMGNVFPVDILSSKTVSELKDEIKTEKANALAHIDADELYIWKLPKPLSSDEIVTVLGTIVDGADIPNAVPLAPMEELSHYFPAPPASKRLHLVTQVPYRDADDLEIDQQTLRSWAIKSAQERGPPSKAAEGSLQRTIQRSDQLDAVYNWRPITLWPPPISIYHPVFAQFTRDLSADPNSVPFTSSELNQGLDIMQNFLQFYPSEFLKRQHIGRTPLFFEAGSSLIPSIFARGLDKTFPADGYRRSHISALGVAMPSEIIELKNEIGKGGLDAIAQAERDYVWLHSSDKYSAVRKISPCPTFLIGINGPYISVSGAVFAESFYSQRLMDLMFIGPRGGEDLNDAIRRVAVLLRAVQSARRTLDDYYETLPVLSSMGESLPEKRRIATPLCALPSNADTCFIGPHFNQYLKDGQKFMLRYKKRFYPKHVFLADATCQNTGESLKVVVKFSTTYGKRGHELLATAKPKALAPKLYYCEKAESLGNLWIIIMEYIEGKHLLDTQITTSHGEDIKAMLELLHTNKMVFGDLRKGNILFSRVGAKLLDFDWCGEEGQAFYPPSINLSKDENDESSINWHPEVERGAPIKKEHDLYMFKILGQ